MRKTSSEKSPGLAAALLDAVETALSAGWSLHAISQQSRVPYATLHKWHSGAQSQISLPAAEKLAAHFDMRLTKPRRNVSAPPG